MGKRRTTVSSEPAPSATPAPATSGKKLRDAWPYLLAVVAAVVLLFVVF